MLDTEELKHLLQNSTEFTQEVEMLSDSDKNMIIELYKEPFESASKAIAKVLQKTAEIGDVSAEMTTFLLMLIIVKKLRLSRLIRLPLKRLREFC